MIRLAFCIAAIAAVATSALTVAYTSPQGISQPPAAAGALVKGRAVDSDTGRPLRFAQVDLSSRRRGVGARFSVVTSDAGEFEFHDVPPGTYYLGGLKVGYPPAYLGTAEKAVSPPGIPVQVAVGQRIEGLELRLRKGAAISGVVTDEHGAPLSVGIQVNSLTPPQDPDFPLPFYPVTYWHSDADGRYRVYGLAAGEHVVMTSENLSGVFDTLPDGSRWTFTRAFWPNTSDPMDAAPVKLGFGEERGGIDITVRSVPLLHVGGTVIAPSPTDYISVWIKPVTRKPIYFSGIQASATRGQIRQVDVPAGRYVAAATVYVRAPADAPAGTPASLWWSMVPLTLTDRDVTNLVIQLQPAMSLSGQVVEDSTSGSPFDPSSVTITLVPSSDLVSPISERPAGGRPDAAGTFLVRNITPDRYRLTVTAKDGVPMTVTSVTVAGQKLDRPEIDIAAGVSVNGVLVTVRRTK